MPKRGYKQTLEHIQNARHRAWNRGLTKETDKRVRINVVNSNKVRLKLIKSGVLKGWKHSEFSKEKMRKSAQKRYKHNANPFYGKRHKSSTRRKMRMSMIKHIKKIRGSISPNIGKAERQILNELELSLNKKIIRQFYIVGYFVDGYCKELNLVIEVDEMAKTTKRDIIREKEIIKELSCSFVRVEG